MGFTSKQVSEKSRESSEKSSNHQPPLNCPRCNSTNTKFCYYNNYNKTQPRHFCKSCKRHWTQGGTLRDVPIGGSLRRNKHAKTSNKDNNLDSKSSMGSTHLALPSSNNFHYNPLTSFEDFVSPFSFTDNNQFNSSYSDEMTHLIQTSEDPSITSYTTREEAIDLSWNLPSTSSFVDYSNDWSYWDDFNKLISSTDISQQWDDLQLQTEEHHHV